MLIEAGQVCPPGQPAARASLTLCADVAALNDSHGLSPAVSFQLFTWPIALVPYGLYMQRPTAKDRLTCDHLRKSHARSGIPLQGCLGLCLGSMPLLAQ